MDAIDNQLGAAEWRCDDYDCNYVDDRGNDDNDDDERGGSVEMAVWEGTLTISSTTTVSSWMEAEDRGGGRGRGREAEALT